MNSYVILAALRAGETVYMTGRGTPEQEATLGALYDQGVLEIEQAASYGRPVLAFRLRRRRCVRVRVVRPTWYGARVYEAIVEV